MLLISKFLLNRKQKKKIVSNNPRKYSLWNRLHIDPTLLFFVVILLLYSIAITWSASSQDTSVVEHKIIQILVGVLIMLGVAQIPPRVYEFLSPYVYVVCMLLLVLVIFCGQVTKGAQRWLSLGFIHFQPSEVTKVAVPLIIARCINRDSCPPSIKSTVVALGIVVCPTLLIAAQPDLGTAILVACSGLFVLFLSGVSWRFICITALIVVLIIPILWFFLMHDYQKHRIKILLNPKSDPFGAGYHIMQSKIAIGSGSLLGKGWLHGTQSQLEFLPERHTDFIFAVLSEELGFIGVLVLLLLYLGIIVRGFVIALRVQNVFGRITVGSMMLILFVYVFINIGMVSGLLPIVGIPLPLISYGGSSLIVLMVEFGIVMSIHTHRKMLSKNL